VVGRVEAMRRSDQRVLIEWCIANMDDASDSDVGMVQSHVKEFKATGNLRKTAVDSLERIVVRMKRRQSGEPTPKPVN